MYAFVVAFEEFWGPAAPKPPARTVQTSSKTAGFHGFKSM